jgi:3-phosphoshikimate 1-carboxyvinyltransferase
LPDGFVVRGNEAPLRGRAEAHDDHRIAMAFGVLSATKGTDITIDNSDCVAVSYPRFWSELERVTRARLA